MTKIKLPTSNKGTTKLVVASVGILALVSTLLWMTTGAPQAASHPQELRVRSAVSNNASALKQQAAVAADPPPPGTHRYEMILSQLKDEHGTVSEQGKVIIETYDQWAPLGVAHFDTLVENQFYDQCRFFRVVDNFVVQFGINGDPAVQKKWRGDVLKDDPVLETNAYGTITYATSGPNTRTVQLFINTNKHGNGGLDKQGFAPIGKIVEVSFELVKVLF